MRNRQGCLAGLLELFLLDRVFEWLEHRFGFGRGCSCSGCGCGFIILIAFLFIALSIFINTNWTHLIR